jgi:hypothetical protein
MVQESQVEYPLKRPKSEQGRMSGGVESHYTIGRRRRTVVVVRICDLQLELRSTVREWGEGKSSHFDRMVGYLKDPLSIMYSATPAWRG